MDDLAFVSERIESYADYTNDDDRRRSDEQTRAYVGEALARLFERLQPSGSARETLERALLRCQFADQVVVRAFDFEQFGDVKIAAIRAADRGLVELAGDADTIDAAGAEAFVAKIDAAFDRRAEIITNDAATPQAPRSESSRTA